METAQIMNTEKLHSPWEWPLILYEDLKKIGHYELTLKPGITVMNFIKIKNLKNKQEVEISFTPEEHRESKRRWLYVEIWTIQFDGTWLSDPDEHLYCDAEVRDFEWFRGKIVNLIESPIE